MELFINIFKGFCIGTGAILPGISSGVICVILGIYENLINSLLGFFKDTKKNFNFLLPIVIGGFLGFFIFGNFLNYLLTTFPVQIKSIFIGLILGSIPSLIKSISSKCKIKISYFAFSFVSFIIGLLLIYIENCASLNLNININFYYYLLAGFAMSIGVVVPGISSTVILMIMGIYSIYLNSIATLNFSVLFPIAIGLFFGCIFFMIIIKYLFKHYYCQTFFSIIGFTLGSIGIIFPPITSLSTFLLAIVCCFLGFYVSFCTF